MPRMHPRYFADSRYYASSPDPATLCPAPARPGLDLCGHLTMTIQPSPAGGPRFFATLPNPRWQPNLDLSQPHLLLLLLLLVLLLLLLLAAPPRSFAASPATATVAAAAAATVAAATVAAATVAATAATAAATAHVAATVLLLLLT